MKSLLRTLTILALAAVPCLSWAQTATAAAPADNPPAAAAAAAPAAPMYKDVAAFKESPGYSTFTVNNTWMMLSAGLVFIMHLGFATLETGLTR